MYYYKKEKEIFSPMVMFCLLAIIHYVPGIMYIENYFFISINESMAFIVFIYESLAVICTTIGYSLYHKTTTNNNIDCKVVYINDFSLHTIGIILYIIGFVAGVIYLRVNGGISFLISGIKNVKAGNGNSYIRALMFLMVLGMCLILEYRTKKGLKPISFEIITLFIIYAFFFIIQTSRSPVLEAVMILMMASHYCGNRISLIKLLRPKNILIILIAVLYIVIMPTLRTTNGFTDFSLAKALSDGINNIGKVFDELCYTGRDGFIYQNYDFEKRWHGGNIINLVLAPIPSAIFKGKPPVDDGMYLANAATGNYIKPPSSDLPWYNSWPLSTPGGLFINFGLIGIIIGSIALGYFYGTIYNKLKKHNYDVVNVIFYQLVIYQLEFSSLSIVQTLTPAVIVYVSITILGGRRVILCTQKNQQTVS